MMKTKAVTQTVTTTTRVINTTAKEGQSLTSLEEAVVRMHHGVSLKNEGVLATNGVTQEIFEDLLRMELEAFEKSGRIENLQDIPAGAQIENPKTLSLIASLKSL